MTNPAKLVQLIRKHGHEACVKPDGVIHASWWHTTPEGITYKYTDIPATLPAVMRWLGY